VVKELFPEMTFEQFVTGESNLQAIQLAKTVAEPASPFSCLLIIGDIGTGKTHLIQAACQKALERGSKIFYLTGYELKEQISLFRIKRELREEEYDLLALDDIQLLAGRTQIETHHFLTEIIDSLNLNRKKLLVGSSRPPESIRSFSPNLSSRLNVGLRIILTGPDQELKTKILCREIKKAGLSIEEEQIRWITSHSIADFRRLISIARNLIARARLDEGIISDGIIKEVLEIFSTQKEFSIKEIMAAVCRNFKVEEEQLKLKSRKAEYTLPRHVFLYLCRTLIPRASLETIGQAINRNHSTALYGIKALKERMQGDPELERKIDLIIEKLEAN